MSADTRDDAAALRQVVEAKAAWRRDAQSLSWEEKVAAIEGMRASSALLKTVRERNIVSRKAGHVA